MYANGHGVKQDAAEAVRWYRKAADQGHASPQYNLPIIVVVIIIIIITTTIISSSSSV